MTPVVGKKYIFNSNEGHRLDGKTVVVTDIKEGNFVAFPYTISQVISGDITAAKASELKALEIELRIE